MLVATCQSCGQNYQAPAEFAGKLMQCPSCGGQVPVPATTAPPAVSGLSPQRNEPASPIIAAVDPSLQKELAEFNDATKSSASRPGLLRVAYLRYVRLFPQWPFVFFFWTALMFLVACVVHWLWFILALPSLFCLWFHHRRTKARFIGGCINPGMIVSLDPPLVAVSTNLARAEGADCPVIQILEHPISAMGNIEQKVGACFPAVALYFEDTPGPHWNDFDPVAANCATTDLGQLNRMMLTIDESEWLELEFGLSQIPKPFEAGLYRVFLKTQRRPQVDVAQVVMNVVPHSPEHELYLGAYGIPPHILQRVMTGYAAGVHPNHILAVIGAFAGREIDHSHGLIVIPQGLVYQFKDMPPGRIPWNEIRGAMFGLNNLEIVKTTYERIRIPAKSFRKREICWSLDALINTVCNNNEG